MCGIRPYISDSNTNYSESVQTLWVRGSAPQGCTPYNHKECVPRLQPCFCPAPLQIRDCHESPTQAQQFAINAHKIQRNTLYTNASLF